MWFSLTTGQRLSRALALAVVAAAIVLRVMDPDFVADLRFRGFDVLQQLWPLTTQPVGVVVVEVDDKSLAQYGQWPWPRSRLAKLVRNIAAGKPAALGVDIIFAEADRLSPPEIVRELPDLPPTVAVGLIQMAPSEQELAEAMRAVPTVLAAGPEDEPAPAEAAPLRVAPIRQAGGDATGYLTDYASLLRPLPRLAAAAAGIASIAVKPDEEGIVRRVPLAVVVQGSVFPSLALETLRIAFGGPPVVIDTGSNGIRDIKLADLVIPTDPRGRALLHFSRQHERPLSAADVLDPAFDPAQLQGKIVLLGVTGVGTVDQKETPLGSMQGIDIHAQLLESMLLGTLLQRPWSLGWIELTALLAAGLVTIWALPYNRPRRAAVSALGVVAVLLGTEVALFRFAGVLFDGTFAALTTLAAFGVMLVSALRTAEAALGRERELRHRQEGELAAAQAIQMGLMPRRALDRADIDLSARIEPARMVGGDFYEYMLVDHDRRLFFLIADVSDKGMPAALFMALTKEIVRDAVLRFAPSLELILAEVNRRTTEASRELPTHGGDMMFVTAFAGILDLESGAMSYASAGHDPPFILGGNPGLRKLLTEGGPPFGAVDPFPFPVDRDRIAPGEVLLLYTDGITEAQNTERALYSGERLERVLKTATVTAAEQVITAIVEDVRRFVGPAEQADDITLLALRRAG